MIKNITIKNLLGVEDINIELEGQITLLTGANGVGKSTVLDAIQMANNNILPRRTTKSRAEQLVRNQTQPAIVECEMKDGINTATIFKKDVNFIKKLSSINGKSILNDNNRLAELPQLSAKNRKELMSEFANIDLILSIVNNSTLLKKEMITGIESANAYRNSIKDQIKFHKKDFEATTGKRYSAAAVKEFLLEGSAPDNSEMVRNIKERLSHKQNLQGAVREFLKEKPPAKANVASGQMRESIKKINAAGNEIDPATIYEDEELAKTITDQIAEAKTKLSNLKNETNCDVPGCTNIIVNEAARKQQEDLTAEIQHKNSELQALVRTIEANKKQNEQITVLRKAYGQHDLDGVAKKMQQMLVDAELYSKYREREEQLKQQVGGTDFEAWMIRVEAEIEKDQTAMLEMQQQKGMEKYKRDRGNDALKKLEACSNEEAEIARVIAEIGKVKNPVSSELNSAGVTIDDGELYLNTVTNGNQRYELCSNGERRYVDFLCEVIGDALTGNRSAVTLVDNYELLGITYKSKGMGWLKEFVKRNDMQTIICLNSNNPNLSINDVQQVHIQPTTKAS